MAADEDYLTAVADDLPENVLSFFGIEKQQVSIANHSRFQTLALKCEEQEVLPLMQIKAAVASIAENASFTQGSMREGAP